MHTHINWTTLNSFVHIRFEPKTPMLTNSVGEIDLSLLKWTPLLALTVQSGLALKRDFDMI